MVGDVAGVTARAAAASYKHPSSAAGVVGGEEGSAPGGPRRIREAVT